MRKSLFCKTFAVILSVLLLLSTVFFAAATVFAAVGGAYTGGYGSFAEGIRQGVLEMYANDVVKHYRDGHDLFERYSDNNFYFEAYNSSGEALLTNLNGAAYTRKVSVTELNAFRRVYHNGDAQDGGVIYVPAEVTEATTEEVILMSPVSADEVMSYYATVYQKVNFEHTDLISVASFWLDAVYIMRYSAPVIALVSFIIFALTLIFLFAAAGHRKGTDEPMLNRIDGIPFDFYTAICLLVLVFLFICFQLLYEIVAYNVYYSLSETLIIRMLALSGIAAICITAYLVVLGYLLSFATRVKVGGLIRRTLIYRLVALVFRYIKKLFCGIGRLLSAIPLVWKTALIFIGVSAFELIFLLCNLWEGDNILIFWFLEKLILFPLIIGIAMLLRKLKKGGEAIAAGRINEKIDTAYMPLDFGSFGRTLNSIGDGLSVAVDERLKSERMKTELITNVSHDIKTPLTSIVNYVDLIKNEEIESETLREYVDVLDRQSARLKKLIEDLVEASKASTGNISVEMERIEVGVLLEQSLGEYSEKFSGRRLQAIVTQPKEPVFIMADGRRLWRVFDNLLNNICKYALSDTRVYISIEKADKNVTVMLRNISREQLNISSEELMERFVRGDSSRNTDGSGLGLSIARSLTELMGGSLSLSIDGDLFKAVLSFNLVE